MTTRTLRVEHTKFHIVIDDVDRIVNAYQLGSHEPGSTSVKLRTTFDEQRYDGDTLHVGAAGMILLIGLMLDHDDDPRALWSRLQAMFSGSATLTEMTNTALRMIIGMNHAPGEHAYYLAQGRRQLDVADYDVEWGTV
jgi:hypothetical protein